MDAQKICFGDEVKLQYSSLHNEGIEGKVRSCTTVRHNTNVSDEQTSQTLHNTRESPWASAAECVCGPYLIFQDLTLIPAEPASFPVT